MEKVSIEEERKVDTTVKVPIFKVLSFFSFSNNWDYAYFY